IASVAIGFFSGKLSDQCGRAPVMRWGVASLIVAMGTLAWGSSPAWLSAGAAVYGVGAGILSPAVNAWTIDLSHPQHRGKAMATMYIALEAGIGLGALIAGWIYHDVIAHIPYIFFGTMVVAVAALVYLWNYR